MNTRVRDTRRPEFDEPIRAIAHYVSHAGIKSPEAWETARYCLMDSLGCAILALNYPACTKLLGPTVPGAELSGGAKIPGTKFELDPVRAAFNIGTMIRWLDFNDTWLAAEWGHPSDNMGGILAVADYISRRNLHAGKPPLLLRQVLEAMIKAHEIQGVIALENAFNRVGLDHVMLVRIASTAVITHMLGGSEEHIQNAVSHAWLDGCSLRTYRHAPNTGSRKSWAAGDATSRAVQLALIALTDEMGYPSAITAKEWGFQDVLYKGEPLKINQKYASYVMENVLFKLSFPAEFHAQTAVEAAVALHPHVLDKLEQIDRIIIETQESGLRIIDKTGPLNNPADRDHCIQYMVAIALITGNLTADDYEDGVAANVLIDTLRGKMDILENPKFTRNYLNPSKRSIANAIQVFFKNGTQTSRVEVEYPIGHRRRRAEGMPVLQEKFEHNIATRLSPDQCKRLRLLCDDQARLEQTPVNELMDLMAMP